MLTTRFETTRLGNSQAFSEGFTGSEGCSQVEEFKDDREVVKAAIGRFGSRGFWHASERLKSDRRIVLEAVEKNGRLLQCIAEKLRGDRDVVIKAISEHYRAIDFASEAMIGKSLTFTLPLF